MLRGRRDAGKVEFTDKHGLSPDPRSTNDRQSTSLVVILGGRAASKHSVIKDWIKLDWFWGGLRFWIRLSFLVVGHVELPLTRIRKSAMPHLRPMRCAARCRRSGRRD